MSAENTKALAIEAIESLKGLNIVDLHVAHLTTVTDYMIIATGTSNRHVKSIAEHVVEHCKANGQRPMGIEGLDNADWVLIDLGDAVVHIMLEETRSQYELEKFWSAPAENETVAHS